MIVLWNLWRSSHTSEAASHQLKTNDISIQLEKAWTAIEGLSIICKSDLSNEIKCSFFQVAVVSILLYGCTTWTLSKHIKRKLDGNSTRILWAILNKSWKHHPTKRQLYGHQPPISKTIQIRRTRHVGHCWSSKNKLISSSPMDPLTRMCKCWPFNKTLSTAGYIHKMQSKRPAGSGGSLGRMTRERESGKSVLVVQHGDDDIYVKMNKKD